MKFEIQEATSSHIEAAKSIYGPDTGDLSAPAVGLGWPPTDPNNIESARKRVEWSCQQQKDLLENDPTTRFIKVIDANKHNEIVAFGRWHRYPNGFQQMGDLEIAGLKDRDNPSTWPENFNKGPYLGFFDEACAARTSWMGSDHCWVLTTVRTREPLQKKGAGSLIPKWGLEQAAKEAVPAYLEAFANAKHLYEIHGFREIGLQKVDCTPFGMPGVVLEVARIRADPNNEGVPYSLRFADYENDVTGQQCQL